MLEGIPHFSCFFVQEEAIAQIETVTVALVSVTVFYQVAFVLEVSKVTAAGGEDVLSFTFRDVPGPVCFATGFGGTGSFDALGLGGCCGDPVSEGVSSDTVSLLDNLSR